GRSGSLKVIASSKPTHPANACSHDRPCHDRHHSRPRSGQIQARRFGKVSPWKGEPVARLAGWVEWTSFPGAEFVLPATLRPPTNLIRLRDISHAHQLQTSERIVHGASDQLFRTFLHERLKTRS